MVFLLPDKILNLRKTQGKSLLLINKNNEMYKSNDKNTLKPKQEGIYGKIRIIQKAIEINTTVN